MKTNQITKIIDSFEDFQFSSLGGGRFEYELTDNRLTVKLMKGKREIEVFKFNSQKDEESLKDNEFWCIHFYARHRKNDSSIPYRDEIKNLPDFLSRVVMKDFNGIPLEVFFL